MSTHKNEASVALSTLIKKIRYLEEITRPINPKAMEAINRRWKELPNHVKTDSQTLGKVGVGCEGTHGVFPKCNFACSPCYHSEDANKVKIDGKHTIEQVKSQMEYLHRKRSSYAHAQLIGGEVTLLDPHDHARTLEVMRSFGREPMSFTHGDFDYDYLKKLVTQEDGKRRFERISFAGHFDSTMVGRRGQRRVSKEEEIDPYRQRFCEMFKKLKKEMHVKFYLAHNMTVTPQNVDQISGVIARCKSMGFNMFSFQPAAYVGDERRWKEDYGSLDPDYIWHQIEIGIGTNLPYHDFEVGDVRCNRSAWGVLVGDQWHPFIDITDKRDREVRDFYLNNMGGFHFNIPLKLLIPRLIRFTIKYPKSIPLAVKYAIRFVNRLGGIVVIVKNRITPFTVVMHRFMHAEDVLPAYELLKRNELSSDLRIRETQERLLACSYAMAHPESDEIVPACVQHSLLDPVENKILAQSLPLPTKRKVNQLTNFKNV